MTQVGTRIDTVALLNAPGRWHKEAIARRFWQNVDRRGPSECWLWTGRVGTNGYGQTRVRNVGRAPHQVAYALSGTRVTLGMTLDHLCRNRLCCNPAHLEVVTHAENIARGEGAGVVNSRKTRCPRGHVYGATWVYVAPSGRRLTKRVCAVCERERSARRRVLGRLQR